MGCDFNVNVNLQYLQQISIHAARVGCDNFVGLSMITAYYFNPRSPSGLRPNKIKARRVKFYFNPRSPSGLRLPLHRKFAKTSISIHAARVGCDIRSAADTDVALNISIHAARVGCDGNRTRIKKSQGNFNPRSPSGLRLNSFSPKSTTATFQSTQPEWAATGNDGEKYNTAAVFQSTQPEWAATKNCLQKKNVQRFQSTQPEWAATILADREGVTAFISIHAARVGCDICRQQFWRGASYFNPRSPSGLRLKPGRDFTNAVIISIHAARVGCDA